MDEEASDSDEELEDGEIPQAPRVRNSSAQTGGPKDTGKKVVVRRTQRLGDATARLKVMTPFFQLVDLREHMRQLLAAYAALSAQKHGDTLEVIKGTKIREVPSEYLSAKKELLENGDLNRPDTIKVSLAQFKEKWRRIQ